MITKFDEHVFEGIRKTINRFREKPFHYFTEADIHSSLLNDMISGSAGTLTRRIKDLEVSLVHQEYPTNFRYEKSRLLNGYGDEWEDTRLYEGNKYGDRGNFDLAILNEKFVQDVIQQKGLTPQEALEHIINKDVDLPISRMNDSDDYYEEIRYAIEVKFIHAFNARNKSMLEEVIKDNEKLRLAYLNSNGNIKPVNLVFCSYFTDTERSNGEESVITKIRKYTEKGKVDHYDGNDYEIPRSVITIFIQSYLKDQNLKSTPKPVASPKPSNDWANKLRSTLRI